MKYYNLWLIGGFVGRTLTDDWIQRIRKSDFDINNRIKYQRCSKPARHGIVLILHVCALWGWLRIFAVAGKFARFVWTRVRVSYLPFGSCWKFCVICICFSPKFHLYFRLFVAPFCAFRIRRFPLVNHSGSNDRHFVLPICFNLKPYCEKKKQ